jgi:hypothetical protein
MRQYHEDSKSHIYSHADLLERENGTHSSESLINTLVNC